MTSFWVVAYDSENSENPGQYVEITVAADGALQLAAPPEPTGDDNG